MKMILPKALNLTGDSETRFKSKQKIVSTGDPPIPAKDAFNAVSGTDAVAVAGSVFSLLLLLLLLLLGCPF